ncbi:MAG: linalool dehydratase/isomerase domain-containing protein [Sporichthyaceae bacterium]
MTTFAPHDSDLRTTVAIPPPVAALPPVTARKLGTVLIGYAVLWLAGALPSVFDAGRGLTAAGLGLTLPGGGFLYGGHEVLFGISLVLLFLGVFLWWALGIVLAPAIAWIGTAAWAGAVADTERSGAQTFALLALPVLIVFFTLLHLLRHRAQARTGVSLNAELARVPFLVTGPPALGTRLPVAESSAEDLAHLRTNLDLALQPIEKFAGFDRLDEFREGATRYQLNSIGYGLSMAQYTRTPAFTGYLGEAQRNLIEKMLQPEVWNYWALENAWGNLRLNRDPIDTPDNIMITGYWGTQIAMYEWLNDDRYSAPGSLTFRHKGGASYEYDFGALARITDRNFGQCAFTMFPCEPNWIYSVCNMFGINTLLGHDTLHGTTHLADRRGLLRQAFEQEFTRPDGKVIGVRSKLLGLSWNMWAGPMVQVNSVYWLHAAYPDLAHRTWWLLRRKDLRIEGGKAVLPTQLSARLDPGNYKLGNDTFAQVACVMAARELGDVEFADAAQRALDAKPTIDADGARRYKGASVWTNSYATLGRFGRHSGLRDLLAFGVPGEWRSGPVLAEAGYPDVLVAKAVTDGRALDLVLRPGNGPVRTRLAVERLVPYRTYTVVGALTSTVNADAVGRAEFEVDLGDRLEVRVY